MTEQVYVRSDRKICDRNTNVLLGIYLGRRGELHVVEDRQGVERSCNTLELAVRWLQGRWADGHGSPPDTS